MRLYGAIEKVEPQNDGTVRVHGIATSEAVDDQGEVVRADAMRAAVPDYMRFPALREMHQLTAAGTTLEVEVGDDDVTRIVAHVVDPIAIAKVKNKVYRGFSIGGRVTQREAGNPKTITGLVLNEISLVDRPANPEAIFDCWKAATMSHVAPFNPPVQIWACGISDHQHVSKAEAIRCLEKRAAGPTEAEAALSAATAAMAKAETTAARSGGGMDRAAPIAAPGYLSDLRKRDPIGSERHIRAAWSYINKPGNAKKYTEDEVRNIRADIAAAWREKIDNRGPPVAENAEKATGANTIKALWDVGHIAQIILDLDWLSDALEVESAIEGHNSPQPARLRAIITELCSFLNALVAEETGEIIRDAELDGPLPLSAMPGLLAMAADAAGAARIDALSKTGSPRLKRLASDLLAKAKHSQGDQTLIDLAYLACDKCLKINGLSADERDHIDSASVALRAAGARSQSSGAGGEEPTTEGENARDRAEPMLPLSPSGFRPGTNATPEASKALDMIFAALGKRGRAHQHLIDVAHECVRKLTDGATCEETTKTGARHSQEMMGNLREAHDHMVAAGGQCTGISSSDEALEGAEIERANGAQDDLMKVLADERVEKAALIRALDEMVPMLDRLTKRVEDIARTPLPPLTIAKSTYSVSKQQDRGSDGGTELSPDAIASALAKMSKEEQTLTLIKASYANPIRVLGPDANDQ